MRPARSISTLRWLWKSARGLAQSRTLARRLAPVPLEASWSAPVLWRSGPRTRRRPSLSTISSIVTSLFVLASALSAASAPAHFNLISIVTDDQATWSIGAYGSRESKTPNIDRLAREGARFLNAFTCTPVCSPSRAAFLTGRYGTQFGITDWITLRQAKRGLGLDPAAKTWPKLLRQRGYVTGLIGKWHLGDQPQFHPTRLGFDEFTGALAGSFKPKDPVLEVAGKPTTMPGFGADILTDAALAFIETNRARPFALLIHHREPHAPYAPVPDEDAAVYQSLDPSVPAFPNLRTNQVKNWTREYYGAVRSVDRNLGRLLARLDETGLATNTIVMFTSDHGYMIGHHGLHHKGNARWIAGGSTGPTRPNMFEESIRIPLLIRWPGVVRPGLEIAEPVSNIDTWASVLGMLGFNAPRGWKQEGRDFTPLLRGRPYKPRDAIFSQYDLHNGGLAHMRMARTADWKLVRHYLTSGMDELYDLKNDPGETKNLYDAPSAAAARDALQQQLTAWMRSINDPLLPKLKE